MEEERPKASLEEEQPKTAMEEEHPKASLEEEQPKTAMEEEHPKASLEEEQPTAAMEEEQPKASLEEEQPKTAMEEEHPKASLEEEQPTAAMEEEQPKASLEEEQPKTAMEEEHPKASLEEEQPTAAMEEECKTLTEEEQPRAVIEEEQPKASLDDDGDKSQCPELAELWLTVRSSQPLQLRRLIKALPDKSVAWTLQDEDGMSLMHRAVWTVPNDRVFAVVALLLQSRAEVDPRNLLGETPLMLACRAAMERPVDATISGPWLRPLRKLLEARADPNAADLSGEPPLIEAACAGDVEVCQLLLEANADASPESSVGMTALGFAESEGHREVVELLLKQHTFKSRPFQEEFEPKSSTPPSGHLEEVREVSSSGPADQDVSAEVHRKDDPEPTPEPTAEATADAEEPAMEADLDLDPPKAQSFLETAESLGSLVPAYHSGPVLRKEESAMPAPKTAPAAAQIPRSFAPTPARMVPPPAMPATSAPSYGAAQQAAPRMASAKSNGWAGPYTGYRYQSQPVPMRSPAVNLRQEHTRHAKASRAPAPTAKPPAPKPQPARPAEPSDSDEAREDCGPRVRKAMEQFPSYSGEMPPQEAETTWSDQELYNYFFSSGFIKPKKKGTKPKPTPQQMEQYYTVLNLRPGAKAAAIKKSFRQLALRFHPDKNRDSPEATLKFQEITEAYEVICRTLESREVMSKRAVPAGSKNRKNENLKNESGRKLHHLHTRRSSPVIAGHRRPRAEFWVDGVALWEAVQESN
ncbi:unnamed protein product [Cladocopium goreaui]|uniref:Chaperone protein DnaJ n=1 Tax=Cladocopium goreaui TaxID=2562237 RepID=A0A9P1DMU9_9DINO|nr:unnamed protein product [Cladocopium goreaui]